MSLSLTPGSRKGAQTMTRAAVRGRSLWDDARRRLLRNRRYLPSGMEIDNLKNLVTEQLRYRVSGGTPDQAPPSGPPMAPSHNPGSGGTTADTNPLLQGLRPHRRPAAREPMGVDA